MTTDPDRIAALTAQNEALRRALEYYADHYCEGWCKEDDRILDLDACGGCAARKALALPAPEPGSEYVVVPKEPTEAKIYELHRLLDDQATPNEIYRAVTWEPEGG